jgi:hypothetical protein
MPDPAWKRALVRAVKPRVSPVTWQGLRKANSFSDVVEVVRAARRGGQATRTMNLNELAVHFKTDKWGAHRYTQHYENHFAKWRNERFTMLEIGIGGYSKAGQGGASLRMWKHFFGRAQIVGLDIQDKSFVEEDRIRAYQGSQVDMSILQRIVDDVGSLRIIIDDGSHRPEHVRKTFAMLFPLLEDGGIYAIEDTQTSYWPEWGGSEDRYDRGTSMALVKDLIDGLNYEEYVDENYEPTYSDLHVVAVHAYHNLVLIEKGTNAEGTKRRTLLKARYAAAAAR